MRFLANCDLNWNLISWAEKKELSLIIFKLIMLEDFDALWIVYDMFWQMRKLLITLWVPTYMHSMINYGTYTHSYSFARVSVDAQVYINSIRSAYAMRKFLISVYD